MSEELPIKEIHTSNTRHVVGERSIEKIELGIIRVNGDPYQRWLCLNKDGEILVDICPLKAECVIRYTSQ